MRVIGGKFRSRKLKPVPGYDVRPTPDRLRETLFNVLAPQIAGAVFVDAYAGTGAVGIEALSRGARRVVFIEHSRPAISVLRENLAALEIENECEVVTARAAGVIARYAQHAIVFLDPPYPLEREYTMCLEALSQIEASLVIAQHSSRFDPGESWGKLTRARVLKQGDNSLTFYKRNPSSLCYV